MSFFEQISFKNNFNASLNTNMWQIYARPTSASDFLKAFSSIFLGVQTHATPQKKGLQSITSRGFLPLGEAWHQFF
jgi:hypothetical protein